MFKLGEQADQADLQLPEGLVFEDEIAIREKRLANPAQAKAVLEARAQERYGAEKAEYEAKQHEREEKSRKTVHKPRGRKLKPLQPGPRDKDQYNFTDPDSRITSAPTAGTVRKTAQTMALTSITTLKLLLIRKVS